MMKAGTKVTQKATTKVVGTSNTYELVWHLLKDQLQRDYQGGHIQKSLRALTLIEELEEKYLGGK